MPYTVDLPDGRTVEFPDEVSLDKAGEVIRTQFPEFAPKTTIGGYAKEALKGIPSGAIGLLESAATGASALLPTDLEKKARTGIASLAASAKAPFAAAPGYEDSIPRKGSEALGSTIPFFLAGPLGMAGRVGATALGVGAGAGEARVRAEEGGATEGQKSTSTLGGAAVGSLEMLPVFKFIEHIGKPLADGAMSQIKRAFATGGAEAAQEASTNILQNLIAKGLYKPEQAVFEGAGEAAAYGGGIGALIQGLTDLAIGRRAKGAGPTTPAPAPAPEPTAPTPVAPAPALPAPTPLPALEAPTPEIKPEPPAPAPVEPVPAPEPPAPAPVEPAEPAPKRAAKVEEEPIVSEPAAFAIPAPVAEAPTPVAPTPVAPAPVAPTPVAPAPRDYITEEQRILEQREEPTTPAGEPIPRTLVSFAPRRRLLDEIAKKADYAPDKRAALEQQSNNYELAYKLREAAKTQLNAYNERVQKEIANKTKTLDTNINLYAETKGKIAAINNELANELLNKNELERVRKDPKLRAVLEAPKRAKLNGTLAMLNNELLVRENKIAEKSGLTRAQVKRTLLPTKAEKQEQADKTLRQTRGLPISSEYEEYYDYQPKQREIGPVARPEMPAPRQFNVGVPSESEKTKTTPEGISVARGAKQRDVPITSAEMKEANVAGPSTAMGPKLTPAEQSLRRDRELAEIAANSVKELKAKLTALEDRATAYEKLKLDKAEEAAGATPRYRTDVAEKIAAEKERVQNEIAAAVKESNRLASEVEVGRLRGTSGPNDTPLSANNIDMLAANDLAAVLDNIADQSDNPVARRIAGKLADVARANDVTSRVVEVTTEDKPNAPGMTSRNGRRVYINQNTGLSEETVVHEAAHAATMFELEKPDSELTPDQRDAKEELTRMMETVKADPAFSNEVIQDGDIHEFVAEGLGSKAVQDYMRKNEWDGRNLWRRFVDSILNFVGIKTPSKGPMLEQFLDAAEQFIRARDTAAAPQIERLRSTGGLLSPKNVKYANPGLEEAGAVGDTFIAKEKGVIDRVRAASGGFLGLETQYVDRFAPLERIAKTMDPLKGSQMMYYLRMYDQRMNYTAQSVANGAIQRVAKKRPDGGTEYVVESVDGANIQQVVDILKKAPAGSPDAANRLFTMYLAGIRAKNKGFQTLHFGNQLTPAALNKAMESIRATPGLEEKFNQARDVYNEYNRNMVNFLAQSGAISKEHAARLTKENDYIPFYREQNGVAELTIGGEAPIRIGSVKDQPHLHELVGGDRPIFDFLTSSVQNTALITDMGLRNLATKKAVNELQDMKLAQIRPGPGPEGTKIVRFKADGKDYHAVIDTDSAGIPADLLVKGMQGIPTQIPSVIRVLGIPARVLRKAVTLSPVYAARQLFRDSIAAPLLSGANFTPVIGALREVRKSATQATLERRGITGGQVFTGTSEDMSKILKDMLAGKGNLGTLIAKAESLNMEADAATRRAQYNSYINQGLSEMEATLMALESMNFNKRGASPSVHMTNALIPFFNSQIQGLNVLYKSLTGQMPFDKRLKIQEKLITRGALMFATSLAYAALMQDDEAYKNATPEQKYGNWFIRIPGVDEPVKLPIPFEVGYFFKALPEALYNMMVNEHGTEEAFKAFKAIILQTIPGGTSYGIPQAFKPAIEYGLGKSFYTGRDTLSRREQALLPEEQFRENTSEIAKMMGSGFGLSPVKIEGLVSGYTGTMGLALMQLLSMGVPTGESPEKTAKRLSDLPVVGGSFQPNDAGGIINAVYDRMLEVKQVKSTVDRMLAEGRVDDATKLINKRGDDFAISGMADYYMSHMQQITKFENAIRAADMPGTEKREQLDQLRQIKIQLANTVRGATDSVKLTD